MSRIRKDLESNQNHPGGDMLRRALPVGRQLRVAVVGAGMAGIRASDVLLRHGIEVTVFEARKRIGGRIGQVKVSGHLVDLGPNWLHGTVNNPILDIARECGTVIHSSKETQTAFDEQGARLTAADVTEISETFWGIMSDAFQYSNECSESIPPDKSLLTFIQEKSQDYFNDDSAEVGARKRNLLMKEAEAWGAFVASPTKNQSLKFFWLEECLEGENPFVASTYQRVLERTAEPMLSKADVKLDHLVTCISSKDESVQVTIADGQVFEFDEVVSTLPLGYLKRNKTIFDPAIPPRLSEAIDGIGYGSLDKVYISFPTAFWNRESEANNDEMPGKSMDNRPLLNLTADSTPSKQNTPSPDANSDKEYPGITYWFAPTYAPDQNPASWTVEAMNLACLPPDCAHPTFLFYIFGDCALHIAELAHKPDSTALITKFFQPYIALLPNYRADSADCTPSGVLATAWRLDELAGFGSYANFQIPSTCADKDIERMREGMPERRVWFAGEHTAPFVALGTVTGAYWSGEAVAKRIVEAYGMAGKE